MAEIAEINEFDEFLTMLNLKESGLKNAILNKIPVDCPYKSSIYTELAHNIVNYLILTGKTINELTMMDLKIIYKMDCYMPTSLQEKKERYPHILPIFMHFRVDEISGKTTADVYKSCLGEDLEYLELCDFKDVCVYNYDIKNYVLDHFDIFTYNQLLILMANIIVKNL
jgi:hypothetical protein